MGKVNLCDCSHSSSKPDEDEPLNSMERDEQKNKLKKIECIMDMMWFKDRNLKKYVKFLLEIKGDTKNSNSIFD